MSVSPLPTKPVRDAQALDRMVEGLIERHKAGQIRCGWVFFFDRENIPHFAAANTTLSDEAYMIAIMQERMMRLLAEP